MYREYQKRYDKLDEFKDLKRLVRPKKPSDPGGYQLKRLVKVKIGLL